MRRRIIKETPETPVGDKPSTAEKVKIPHDAGNEAIVLAAAANDPSLLAKLTRRLLPDHFVAREHKEAWAALQELHRRQLEYSIGTVEAVAGREVARYVDELARARPDVPANLEWHVSTLLWDAARVSVARGPLPSFLEALRDPKAEPDKVRSLARAMASSFDGYQDRKHLHEPGQLVRDQMVEIEERVAGRACFEYGIAGLDAYEEHARNDKGEDLAGHRRMMPGAAPGQITVVTAVSGGGKSTLAAHLALGLARGGRRVLYGAWEMRGGMTLELLACISLGWSRTELMEGRGPVAEHEGRVQLEERMHAIAKKIRFMGIPFKRQAGEKGSNARNLDTLQGYIADSGCDVFIGDLWKRCLIDSSPEGEEEALIRQQAMAEEMRVHAILLQQQRLKDLEMREDKRPTREGIKGSGAWVEVADTILGVHRPALWKRMDDSHLEVFVLKQRYGRWPLAIEFDWDADCGMISGGRSIAYDRPGEGNEVDIQVGEFLNQKSKRRRTG